MVAVPQERLFNDSKHRKLTEKWCAAMFGLGYEKHVGPCRAAVNEAIDTDVDFFIEAGGRGYPFQLVEVMEPERERGAEFKAMAKGELRSIPYRPERGREEGPGWIAEKIRQKKAKYGLGAVGLNLLVYANFTARQLQHRDVLIAARPYLTSFASVWVLSGLWLGSLHVASDLGRIDGWGEIFTIEQANNRFDDNRRRK